MAVSKLSAYRFSEHLLCNNIFCVFFTVFPLFYAAFTMNSFPAYIAFPESFFFGGEGAGVGRDNVE